MKAILWSSACLLLIAGCAGYSGYGLVPRVSTAEEVEALMGPSAERRPGPGGETVRYYSRQPFGREIYAARFGADERLIAIEQRLTLDNVAKLRPDITRADEVRALLGPPYRVDRFPRMQREAWTYWMRGMTPTRAQLYVQFSPDGVVREVYLVAIDRLIS